MPCVRFLLFPLCVVLCLGCDQIPPRPPIGVSKQIELRSFEPEQPTAELKGPASDEAAVADAESPSELELSQIELEWWDAYFLGRNHVGFSHTKLSDIGNSVKYQVEDQLTFRRGNQVVRQWLKQTSAETLGGGLLSMNALMSAGGALASTDATVRGSELSVATTIESGEEKSFRVPWNSKFGGLFAVRRSLLQNPMEPGEERVLQCLLPVQYVVGTVTLKAIDRMSVSVLDGDSQQLLEIENSVSINGKEMMSSLIWTDDEGRVQKTYTPSLDLLAYRTTRAMATRKVRPYVDLLDATSITLKTQTASENENSGNENAEGVRYRIVHARSNPLDLIPTSPQQVVESFDDRTVDILYLRQASAFSDAPTEDDRNASPFIQSTAGNITDMLAAVLPDVETIDETHVEILRQHVYEYISEKSYSHSFLNAEAVARLAEGDCTEHSVLLTALLRAAGIPSRVAAGLLRVPAKQEVGEKEEGDDKQDAADRLSYHMWTLAWIDGQWKCYDATLPTDVRGKLDRITLVSSSLADGNQYACLYPVLQFIGQVEVSVVEPGEQAESTE